MQEQFQIARDGVNAENAGAIFSAGHRHGWPRDFTSVNRFRTLTMGACVRTLLDECRNQARLTIMRLQCCATSKASSKHREYMLTKNSSIMPSAAPRPVQRPGFSLDTLHQLVAGLATTRANARAGLVADTAVSLLLLGAGVALGDLRTVAVALTILAGLLTFSFVEYCFHRWLFHGNLGAMALGHRRHHDDPQGYDALPFFMPPLAMLALAGVLTTLLPTSVALLLTGALAAGYAAYGLSHTAIHTKRFRSQFVRRWAGSHHIHHHHPQRNFGVTTPLWDILLGTRYASPCRVSDGAPR
jgi:dihydroceramide fatty acyl 2-hydroxylase